MSYVVLCDNLGLGLNKVAKRGDVIEASQLSPTEINRLVQLGAIASVESEEGKRVASERTRKQSKK